MSTFQNGNSRPSPCAQRQFVPSLMEINHNMAASIHPEHQDMGLICDLFLDELPKKMYQDCQEKQDSDPEKPKTKRDHLLRKLSPLAELILFPFQSKPQAKRVANQKDSSATCGQRSSEEDSQQEHSPKEQPGSSPDKKGAPEEEMSSSSEEEIEEHKLEDSKVLPSRGRRPTLEGLWQERSLVRERGILSQLSKEQLLLQEVRLRLLS